MSSRAATGPPALPAEELERLRSGEARAVGRAITQALAGGEIAAGLLAAIKPWTGRGHRVGVTGPPGVGKSTLVAALARRIVERGGKVAVVASDPASPMTGGAFLGDRIRLAGFRLAAEPRVFFRSLARRGAGAVGEEAGRAAEVLDAAGFPWIFLETVGAGQSELAIRDLAPTVIVVTSPDQGDEVQWMKAGILEIADLLVVSHGDHPRAARCREVLEDRAHFRTVPEGGWPVPVLLTDAVRGSGLDELLLALEGRRQWLLERNGSVRT